MTMLEKNVEKNINNLYELFKNDDKNIASQLYSRFNLSNP